LPSCEGATNLPGKLAGLYAIKLGQIAVQHHFFVSDEQNLALDLFDWYENLF
jgi:hypothetical protein